MSGIVLCEPGKSKSFYGVCAFLYLVAGIADVIVTVVW